MYQSYQRRLTRLVCLTVAAAAVFPWGTIRASEAPDITVKKDDVEVANPGYYYAIIPGVAILPTENAGSSDELTLTVKNLHGESYGGIFAGRNDDSGKRVDLFYKNVKFTDEAGRVQGIYGARTANGKAFMNSVNISGGMIGSIDSGELPFVAVGGCGTTNSEANQVAINGRNTTINGVVVGGMTADGGADGNTVSMTVVGSDGRAGALLGGLSNNGTANGNRVTLNDGNIGGIGIEDYGYVAVVGAAAMRNVRDNIVTVYAGRVNGIVVGGASLTSEAVSNIVNISGGEINGDICGGASQGGKAERNRVIIRSAMINGNVYGGYVTGLGTASGNTVEITDGPVFAVNDDGSGICGIYGGKADEGGISYNNKLVVKLSQYQPQSITLREIANFQRYDFIVPVKHDGTVIYNSGEKSYIHVTGEPTHFWSGDVINVGIPNGAKLRAGDSIYLLRNDKGINGVSNVKQNIDALGDDFTETKGIITVENTTAVANNYLKYTVTSDTRLSEDTKSFAETCEAQIATINNASALLVSKGLVNARNAVISAAEQGNVVQLARSVGFVPFAAVGGASMRYNAGSHIDSRGWGMNVGFSRIIGYSNSQLTLAPLIEYGRSSYDSYLNNGTHGDGKNQYLGIGLAAKQEMKSGVYYEGSLRFGRIKGDYNGLDRYDTESNYIAAHAGIGKLQKFGNKDSIDYYGQFFYTRQNGDTVRFKNTGFVYDLDAVNSYKLRLGARWSHQLGKRDKFYAGLAFDYEFDSTARAHYNGLATPAPSLKGSSGMLELGWSLESTKKNPLGLDIGVNGWCGKQRGVTFNLGLNLGF